MGLGERIYKLRISRKWSRTALRALTGVSESTIKQYETGIRKNPRAEQLHLLASAFGVTTEYLLYGSNIDREFELICDTLSSAGIVVEQGLMLDEYFISHADDPEPLGERKSIQYSRLVEVVYRVLDDTEAKKREYLQNRLEAELF